jgi:Tol biopolymer transport system component
VVDVATGTVTSLTAGGATYQNVIKFSPGGDRILFSRTNTNNVSSLWSIGADGSNLHRLVAGTYQGDWQPLSPTQ